MTLAAYEHNDKPVSAEAFYAIACNPRRNVAVEACAGAGKTWMLVSRIVRALLEGAQPQEILAITFTKRAAGEMRTRLLEWLEEFAGADRDTLLQELAIRGISGEMGLESPSNGPELLSNLYQQVLATGRDVQIRTFHSWFAAVLRSAPIAVLQQLGLPVNQELLEDDSLARALVWRPFYAEVAGDAVLRRDFDAAVQVYGRSQTQKALAAALDKRVEFALADAAGVVERSVLHFTVQFKAFVGMDEPEALFARSGAARDLLLAAAAALGRSSARTFAQAGSDLERALTDGNAGSVVAALMTKEGTPRKFGTSVQGLDTVRAAQDIVLSVLAARQQHDAWLHQQRMARLTRSLTAAYAALKRERGWVDMNDVERAALVMLSDPVLSGWVQERLDARVRHLLIDEFQDTNPLQWQALSSWLGSYAGAGRGPSVFIVGDPKQSIYRFRRAEPQVFIAARRFVHEGLGGDLLSCDHTRRNAQQVIGTVNLAMQDAVVNDGYEGFRPHTSGSSAQGTVGRLPQIAREPARDDAVPDAQVWRDSLTTPRELPEETLRTREARQAADWIAAQLAAGLLPQDIMVLSRRRAGLTPLQDALRALGIAARVGDKTELIDCCEVQDVVALLDALVSPQHDLSLARALKSPLFGLTDDELVQIALAQRAQGGSWFGVLQKNEQLLPGRRGLAAHLTRYQGWLATLPPHDALQAIFDDADVLARFAAAAPAASRDAVLANLRALPGAALQVDGARYATPYAFVRALKAGGVQAPAVADPHAVRLLTIHGAKGLEARAVLLLDTDMVERNAESMGVLVDWPGEAVGPQKFVFLASESSPPACALDTLADEHAAREREEINALYVALTRAQETLVVSSIEPHRATTRSWWQRLLPLLPELGVPVVASCAASLAGADQCLLPELPPAVEVSTPSTTARASMAADDDDSVSARIGKAMHRLLEWGLPDGPGAHAAGREFGLTPAQSAQALAMAQRIREGAGAWVFDDALLRWQGNEVEMLIDGMLRRLDRLVQRVDSGAWWVLDYKSTSDPSSDPALVEQLRGYRNAVQADVGAQQVRCAFLTGDGGFVEIG